jgi:hypothetical protein
LSLTCKGSASKGTALSVLSYETAVRALEVQERAVDQMRARTGTLLAVSSLSASFFGAETIQHAGGLGTLGALALVSLVASILLCIYVLLPKRGFVFSLSGPAVYEQLFPHAEDELEVRRRLTYWLEEFWQANEAKLEELGRFYFAAALALVAQLVFWSWALAATIS